jgi:hypothetical protein
MSWEHIMQMFLIGRATLVLKSDGTWEYGVDGPSKFSRAGTWTSEGDLTTPYAVVITLNRFEFGFPRHNFDPQTPSYWIATFEKVYGGKIRTCVQDESICFKRI